MEKKVTIPKWYVPEEGLALDQYIQCDALGRRHATLLQLDRRAAANNVFEKLKLEGLMEAEKQKNNVSETAKISV